MTLKQYQKKRNFRRTPEPTGARRQRAKRPGWLYVVQKHAASHLHYDFRLQIGDTLKSWAVPKGPSLDPSVKRLAMHVEDHPLEYGSFEGTIPEGEYGAGTVMLWDRGTWEPKGDAEAGYRAGKLHFTLHGEKLRGEWVLVRRASPYDRSGKEAWLLFKVRDDEARQGFDVLENEPLSVKTGRDVDEIAQGKKSSQGRVKSHSSVTRANGDGRHRSRPSGRAKLPAKFQPQLATLVKQPPQGDRWLSEIKFDGYRMICRIEQGKARFFSRNGLDWSDRFPHLLAAARRLPVKQALIDGEIVAQQPDGTTSFAALQNALSERRDGRLVYFVFDLLHLDGHDLRDASLEERKQLLARLIGKGRGAIHYSEHTVGGAAQAFREACKLHLEGIICKRRDAPYRAGRTTDWLKIKCAYREEFVIGGYTPPSGARHGFGAILVGYHDRSKKLRYAGRVGTGYSEATLAELARRLEEIEQSHSPFADLAGTTGEARGVHWVKPRLVAQVEFSEWTRDGRLRHPSFQGLREDKPAAQVVLERPLSISAVKNSDPKSESRRAPKRQRGLRTGDDLAGLDDSLTEFGRVRLTHPDKVMYPDVGLTKANLAAYYAKVADWMLPHLVDRPLVLVRHPEGQGHKGFFQKHARTGMPDFLRRLPIREKDETIEYVMVDDLEGLVALVQLGVLEIHAWGCRADKIEYPDRLVFDLDPDPTVQWPRMVESAKQLRAFLADLGLVTFLKTTGGKGLHLVAPIERRHDWDTVKSFCHAVASAVVAADPTRYTATMSKASRHGKIYIDYLRNGRGATAVVPYSTRARESAPVSTPISWEELPKIHSASQFTVQNLPARLARLKADPWKEIASTRQSITASMLRTLGVS